MARPALSSLFAKANRLKAATDGVREADQVLKGASGQLPPFIVCADIQI